MIKIIFLAAGLAIGFAGGVYMHKHNPDAAEKISAEEEKRFLQAQLAITQKIQAKLERLTGGSKTAGSGFLAGSPTAAPVAEVNDLKADTQKQQDDLKKRLAELK